MKLGRGWMHVLLVSALGLGSVYYLMSTPYAETGFLDKGVVLVFLFIAAFFLESKYMPYVGLMPSIVFLFFAGEAEWATMPALLRWYIEAGLVLVLASFLICHVTQARYRLRLNQASFMLYSLKTVFPIYLSWFILGSYSNDYFFYSFVFLLVFTWLFYLQEGD